MGGERRIPMLQPGGIPARALETVPVGKAPKPKGKGGAAIRLAFAAPDLSRRRPSTHTYMLGLFAGEGEILR